jgi:tetratricopeptide (TPR) repeat protein
LLTDDPKAQALLFGQALKVAPEYPSASFQLGRLQLKSKNFAEAEALLGKIHATHDRAREAMFLRGIALYRLGRFSEAIKLFQEVAESVPLNEVLNNLAVAQMHENPDQAVATLEKTVEGDPGDADYHYNLGQALLRSGRMDAAADRFRETLRRRPGDSAATVMLGKALRQSQPSGVTTKAGDAQPAPPAILKENYDESAYLQLKALLDKTN